MPDLLDARCRLCWGDGKCWYCRGAGEIRVLVDQKVRRHACGECAPGSPGRCIRCDGSGTQPDGPEAA